MKLIKAAFLITSLIPSYILANESKDDKTVNAEQVIKAPEKLKSAIVDFDDVREAKNFNKYVEALKKYAKENGIKDEIINIAFQDIYFIERVVKADKNQPEKKVTFNDYIARVVSPQRIELANMKYQAFYDELKKASDLTKVPATFILALWGVESGYGKYQGTEDIISALSTLAFDGRRETFFVKELIASLNILQKGYIDKARFKGSWAGAMGQNQFMPSSYLAYGLDGDGDGIIDIWNNMADVFASSGNYLGTVGWNLKESWGYKIKLPAGFNNDLAGTEYAKSKLASQWFKQGILFEDSKEKPKDNTKMWVIIPESGSLDGFLVTSNFRTLMTWNRSYYFAVSVGMLADSLNESAVNLNN